MRPATCDTRVFPAAEADGGADPASVPPRCRAGAGRRREAADRPHGVAASRPSEASARKDLGTSLVASGDAAGSLAASSAALECDPGLATARLGKACALLALDRPGEALPILDALLDEHPDFAPLHEARGCALRGLRRPAEAVLAFDVAIARAPTCASAHLNRAFCLSDLGRDVDALTESLIVLALHPDHPPALLAQAMFLRHLRKPAAALAMLDRLLAFGTDDGPDRRMAGATRAACLSDLGRNEEALAVAGQIPGDEAAQNRGVILGRLGRHAEAAEVLATPRTAEGWNARAHALIELGRFEEALDGLDHAAGPHPGNPNIPYNRGNALRGLNRHADAVAAFAEARRLEPDFVDAEWNEALSRLALGDYERGLPAYEARWRRRNQAAPRHAAPLWRGEDPAGRTILLHAEQGLGDTIQMLRYVPLLAARGARVVLEVQPPLLPLARGGAGVQAAVGIGDRVPDHDLRCPFMSLPLAFGTRPDGIPAALPYLVAAPLRTAAWRGSLTRAPLRLGVVCSGNANHVGDRHRSIPLSEFGPLLGPEVAAFLVQTEVRDADARFLAEDGRVTPLAPLLTDFGETAAALSALDVLVAVDTSVAHLAGALGRPVHLLLPDLADWRWLLGRADSPWYPTMRLHRRGRDESWADVIARVAAELPVTRAAA